MKGHGILSWPFCMLLIPAKCRKGPNPEGSALFCCKLSDKLCYLDSFPCRFRVSTFSTTRSTSVRKKLFAGCCTAT